MAKKSDEQKVIDKLVDMLDNHWFNPAIVANILVNEYPLYTQNQLMELVKHIIKYQRQRYYTEWEHGTTADSLMLADHLGDVIEMHENPDEYIALQDRRA